MSRRNFFHCGIYGLACWAFLLMINVGWSSDDISPSISLSLSLRDQQPTSEGSTRFHRLQRQVEWDPKEVAVIICDLWDAHHSVRAVRRVQELAPRVQQFVSQMRIAGATIIHAPSECMDAYRDHPARQRAIDSPMASSHPSEIETWCNQISNEQRAEYPLDQSDGGEDDDQDELSRWAEQLVAQGRKPRAPWLRQHDAVRIDADRDFVSDSGVEIWNILEAGEISKVMMVGVHTNMCVLGRPFGLRRLVTGGKEAVLVRDLTDTMYNPRAWPFASHFSGTDLIIDHIERYVCPTISSSQITGGPEFRFAKDHRPQLTMIIAEDEYRTEESLPRFAAKHLSQSFRVTFAYGSDSDRNRVMSLEDIRSADALLISVRRRWLPEADLAIIREFVQSGRPMIGIRTASHPFSMRSGQPPAGYAGWPEFDAQVWGGNYTNHYGKNLEVSLLAADAQADHPILRAIGGVIDFQSGGTLYRAAPLAAGTTTLVQGQVPDQPIQPVAWTYVRADGGRSFYTSLGHVDDFAQAQFEALLSAGIHWACELPLPDLESIESQNKRYNSGQGRQR